MNKGKNEKKEHKEKEKKHKEKKEKEKKEKDRLTTEPISQGSSKPSSKTAQFSPANLLPQSLRPPSRNAGLCLSGGGWRAMMFHVGSLWRMNELGLLHDVQLVSSVSGGSFVAAQLALAWEKFSWVECEACPGKLQVPRKELVKYFVQPLIDLARSIRDIPSGVENCCRKFLCCITCCCVCQIVSYGCYPDTSLEKFLDEKYDYAKLSDLPVKGAEPRPPPKTLLQTLGLASQTTLTKEAKQNAVQKSQDHPPPVFLFNATNLQTGNMFVFSRSYLEDWELGRFMPRDGDAISTVSLATAVAASAAFPPVISPFHLSVSNLHFERSPLLAGEDDPRSALNNARGINGCDLAFAKDDVKAKLLAKAVDEIPLVDGGVFDNLGIDSAWFECRTVFVSDGGKSLAADEDPAEDYLSHVMRVLFIFMNQVNELRKRHLKAALDSDTTPDSALQLLYQESPPPGREEEWKSAILNARAGAYWSIKGFIKEVEHTGKVKGGVLTPNIGQYDERNVRRLAELDTALNKMPFMKIAQLINWGWVKTDMVLRAFYEPFPPQGAEPGQGREWPLRNDVLKAMKVPFPDVTLHDRLATEDTACCCLAERLCCCCICGDDAAYTALRPASNSADPHKHTPPDQLSM